MRCVRLLLLEEEVNMLLLYDKGQLELGNVKGQLLGIEDAQHVNLLYDCLHTALQLAHTLLIARILLENMLQDIVPNRYLLIEIHLL